MLPLTEPVINVKAQVSSYSLRCYANIITYPCPIPMVVLSIYVSQSCPTVCNSPRLDSNGNIHFPWDVKRKSLRSYSTSMEYTESRAATMEFGLFTKLLQCLPTNVVNSRSQALSVLKLLLCFGKSIARRQNYSRYAFRISIRTRKPLSHIIPRQR